MCLHVLFAKGKQIFGSGSAHVKDFLKFLWRGSSHNKPCFGRQDQEICGVSGYTVDTKTSSARH